MHATRKVYVLLEPDMRRTVHVHHNPDLMMSAGTALTAEMASKIVSIDIWLAALNQVINLL